MRFRAFTILISAFLLIVGAVDSAFAGGGYTNGICASKTVGSSIEAACYSTPLTSDCDPDFDGESTRPVGDWVDARWTNGSAARMPHSGCGIVFTGWSFPAAVKFSSVRACPGGSNDVFTIRIDISVDGASWGSTQFSGTPQEGCKVSSITGPEIGIGTHSFVLTYTILEGPSFGNLDVDEIGVTPTQAPTRRAQVTPSSLACPNTVVFQTTACGSVTVSSTGTGAVAIGSPSDDSSDFSVTNGCPSSLGAGQSCTIAVSFRPTAGGFRTGTLSIPTDAVEGTFTVALSGSGLQGRAQLSPSSNNFGDILVGQESAATSFTITNTGNATVTVGSPTVSTGFKIKSGPCSPVPAGSSCQISVAFAPQERRAYSGTLTVPTDAAEGTLTATLTGNGISTILCASPSDVPFGEQRLNSTSSTRTVTLTACGDAAVTITSIGIAGANAPDFTRDGGCQGAVLPKNASCAIGLSFRPTADGLRSASLTITSSAQVGPPAVTLTGTGVSSRVCLSPSSVNFGNVYTNRSSSSQTIEVRNCGTAALNVSQILRQGDADFEILSLGTCLGASVPPAGKCSVEVRFTARAIGSRSGALTVHSDATNSPTSASLLGLGVGHAEMRLSRSSINWPETQPTGVESEPESLTVSNAGDLALNITFVETGTRVFFKKSDGCKNASIPPGGFCTITVAFNASTPGLQTDALRIEGNDPERPSATVPLSSMAAHDTVAPVVTTDYPSIHVRSSASLTYLTGRATDDFSGLKTVELRIHDIAGGLAASVPAALTGCSSGNRSCDWEVHTGEIKARLQLPGLYTVTAVGTDRSGNKGFSSASTMIWLG